MRIDKFLKTSRVLKRRTLAQQACDNGKVVINGRAAKPSKQVKEGDVVEIAFASGTVRFRILKVLENMRKDEADSMYELLEDIPENKPENTDTGNTDGSDSGGADR